MSTPIPGSNGILLNTANGSGRPGGLKKRTMENERDGKVNEYQDPVARLKLLVVSVDSLIL